MEDINLLRVEEQAMYMWCMIEGCEKQSSLIQPHPRWEHTDIK